MDSKLWYRIGDLLAGFSIGATTAFICNSVVPAKLGMLVAMFVSMLVGMVLPIGLALVFGTILGTVEVMVPAAFIGMAVGMWVPMAPRGWELSGFEWLLLGGGWGLLIALAFEILDQRSSGKTLNLT